ncbi:MAG: lipoate--protein ligase family protein [Candidatus Thermoplasmatota archaeon]|nr:lipoate--protein ligase family protein [Candidatus Thermoplasmatota archaeon]
MSGTWRLVDSDMVEPAESAALDEAILESHVAGEVPNTLHFYRRAAPTVSIGYFQKVAETVELAECERLGVAIIRRRSGGSSIYTDAGQLIYGLIVHDADLPRGREESFRLICTAIARAVGSLGVGAYYRPTNDVEIGGRKVSGNAQLLSRGSVLHHGTLLVDTSIVNMDTVLKVDRAKRPSLVKPSDRVATLSSILGTRPDMEAVKDSVVRELAAAFSCRFEKAPLSSKERDLVRMLVKDRYGRKDWNFKI